MKKTYSPKLAEIEHRWFVLDAAGIPLGRLSTLAARLLMGKHKPTYAPHIDTGDFVIVINAEKAVLTGRKEEQKIYYYHTGYPGGIKAETPPSCARAGPTKLVERRSGACSPRASSGRQQLRKLKVYAGGEHPHQAQQPTTLDVAQAL